MLRQCHGGERVGESSVSREGWREGGREGGREKGPDLSPHAAFTHPPPSSRPPSLPPPLPSRYMQRLGLYGRENGTLFENMNEFFNESGFKSSMGM